MSTNVYLKDVRTNVVFIFGRTYVVFLALSRTNVDSTSVCTNVDVGIALTSQINYVCRVIFMKVIKFLEKN